MTEGSDLSRGDLLNWLNSLTKNPLAKIEQLGAGHTYCQLLEIVCPGKVPLSKVHWRAKSEYEFISNFKLLQQCFLKLGLQRNIDINRLVKCKYQDNFEFVQWFKRTFDDMALHSKENIEARRKELENLKLQQRATPLANLNNISVIPPGNVSHIEPSKPSKKINNSSFEEVLGELSVALRTNSNPPALMTAKEERDLYTQLLEEVQSLAETHTLDVTSQGLADSIERLLLQPPPPVSLSEEPSV